jgi:hypothetical protein
MTMGRIKVITKLPNSEQSYKGKVQTHNYINISQIEENKPRVDVIYEEQFVDAKGVIRKYNDHKKKDKQRSTTLLADN